MFSDILSVRWNLGHMCCGLKQEKVVEPMQYWLWAEDFFVIFTNVAFNFLSMFAFLKHTSTLCLEYETNFTENPLSYKVFLFYSSISSFVYCCCCWCYWFKWNSAIRSKQRGSMRKNNPFCLETEYQHT